MRTTSRLMVVVALVIAPMVVWPSDGGTPPAQDTVAPNAEFAKQWKDVRAKYPLVALAYLQSIEALSEDTAQPTPVRRATMETAVRLGVATVARVPTACAPCRLATNSGDVERYLGCVEKRIGCLKP